MNMTMTAPSTADGRQPARAAVRLAVREWQVDAVGGGLVLSVTTPTGRRFSARVRELRRRRAGVEGEHGYNLTLLEALQQIPTALPAAGAARPHVTQSPRRGHAMRRAS